MYWQASICTLRISLKALISGLGDQVGNGTLVSLVKDLCQGLDGVCILVGHGGFKYLSLRGGQQLVRTGSLEPVVSFTTILANQ